MTATSLMYFDSVANGQQYIQDLPTFAIHTGQSVNRGWASADRDTPADFKEMMLIVNPQVPVHLAMPQYYASKAFQPGARYSTVSVRSFKPQRGPAGLETGSGYMTGNPVTMVLHNVMVRAQATIYQWGELPIPPMVQKNYLEKQIGRLAYYPVQVTMFVQWGEVV